MILQYFPLFEKKLENLTTPIIFGILTHAITW
jgi:hypothetical protein